MYFTVGLFFGVMAGLIFLATGFIQKYRRKLYGYKTVEIGGGWRRDNKYGTGYLDKEGDETFWMFCFTPLEEGVEDILDGFAILLGFACHIFFSSLVLGLTTLLYPIIILGLAFYKFTKKKPAENKMFKELQDLKRTRDYLESKINQLKTKLNLENENN